MGSITLTRRSAEVIDIRWAGELTGPDVVAFTASLERELQANPTPWIVGDTTAVTGVDPGARSAAGPLTKMLRANGVDRIIAIAPSMIVRLICSTAALVGGVPLDLVESPGSAEDRLAEVRHAAMRRRRRDERRAPPA